MVHFYDIESLDNVFSLCNFKPDENTVDVYLLCDDAFLMSEDDFKQKLLSRIYERNKNFNGSITLYDLRYRPANEHLAKTFGLSDAYLINDKKNRSSYPDDFRLVCDTDPDYNEDKHPFLAGYNSYNYDTTMLAIYFADVWEIVAPTSNNGLTQPTLRFIPAKAKHLRTCNDDLFSAKFKNAMPSYLTMRIDPVTNSWTKQNYQDARWKIRKNMMLSGRHIDVARLNEKQQKVGLKRLIGMMGGQILESDKLSQGTDHIENTDQLLDLIAYNISDCVNLKYYVFDNNVYQGGFILKKQLLHTYPELIYEKLPNKYAPDIRPECVRRDRLTIDSSSAQFSTKALCPYDHLPDIPCVSFMYPSERKAKELGVPRLNILEESKKFFYGLYPQPELRARFDVIYNYYKSIEGKNFNDSDNYRNDHGTTIPLRKLSEFNIEDTTLPYFNADGTPSTCFVIFSIGGIHGAEYNKVLFDHDMQEYQDKLSIMNYAKQQYPNPVDLKKAKHIEINGEKIPATKFLKTGATLSHAEYKDITKDKPQLFKLEKGSMKLNKKYAYTSHDVSTHEDFTSYYPNLLRMLSAFFNAGLGYDRYAEVFDNKQNYGFLMKEKNQNLTPELSKKYRKLREATGLVIDPLHISEEERALYSILREGTKLILNSASGAGDANFDSNIRMNNMIISMRAIGQMFSWRIGQAQAYNGAKITSTNTDGLYSVLDAKLNNEILERESANIGVEIEPEPVFLISKDSNNRIELDPANGKIISASGGSLACRKGPNPTKSLAHPAIIDWALTEYMIYASFQNKSGTTLSTEFNENAGRNILLHAREEFEPRKYLQMMQNVIASSTGSMNFIFSVRPEAKSQPIIMQHYNRVFIMKDGIANTVHLQAANAKQITPATMKKRQREGLRAQIHDPIAVKVLASNGVISTTLPTDKEAVVKKVTGIDTGWFMRIDNRALCDIPDNEVNEIIDNLDIEKYLGLFRDAFEENWRNRTE